MRDISNNKHIKLDLNFLYNHRSAISLNMDIGDSIDFPLVFPFDKNEYNKIFNHIMQLIKQKEIKWNSNCTISFDVSKNRPNNYNEWKDLINFAKVHNIHFKLNEKIEYSPKELQNYIKKFTTIDNKGQRKLILHRQEYKVKNNPILSSLNGEIFFDDCDEALVVNSQITDTIDNYLANSSKRRIALTVIESKKFDKESLKYAKKAIEHLKKNYNERAIDIIIFSKYHYFDKKEFMLLIELEKYIKNNYKKGYELKFHSGTSIINKTEILNANGKITTIVNYLKKSKLSPYEKVLFVHKLLAEKTFYRTDSDISQDMYAALNSREIVCVSYSTIFNAIFKELNDPNIKTNIQIFDNDSIDSNGNKEFHSINNVYVKDKKYEIEGYYDLDITSNNGSNLLIDFMMPAGDNMHCATSKSRNKVDLDSLPLMSVCEYFVKRDLSNTNSIDIRIRNDIMDNTLNFLDTSMGRKALIMANKKYYGSKLYVVLEAINECIQQTDTIIVDKTKLALENIAKTCFNMNEEESIKYARDVLIESIFHSIFRCDRKKCKNDFAKKSLDIEQGKLDLLKQLTSIKLVNKL